MRIAVTNTGEGTRPAMKSPSLSWGRRGACCAKRVGQRAAQSGRKNGKPGFWPEVRFQGGALVRAADKGEPVGWGGDLAWVFKLCSARERRKEL